MSADNLAVFTLNEVRIGDRLPFGRRVVDVHVLGPYGSPDVEHVIYFNDGTEVRGLGSTTLTLEVER